MINTETLHGKWITERLFMRMRFCSFHLRRTSYIQSVHKAAMYHKFRNNRLARLRNKREEEYILAFIRRHEICPTDHAE